MNMCKLSAHLDVACAEGDSAGLVCCGVLLILEGIDLTNTLNLIPVTTVIQHLYLVTNYMKNIMIREFGTVLPSGFFTTLHLVTARSIKIHGDWRRIVGIYIYVH